MAIIAKSAARTAAVLDYFHQRRTPARGVDIARALGLAPSSANDLLKTLVEAGLLDFHPQDKTYLPSMRLAFQTHWLFDRHRLVSRVEALMEEVRLATGESVVLSTLRDARLQFLHVVGGAAAPPPQVAGGLYAPVFGTAAGGAMLMMTPDRSISALVRRVTRLRPGRALSAKVKSALEQASGLRRLGYAHVAQTEFLPDAWAVAVPLNAPAAVPLALGVGGPGRMAPGEANDLVKLMESRIQSKLTGLDG